ncbi:MAG TPA: hypothetical protein VHW03_00635 [Chthoniobacterales bacterium]|nr:hypothetical protein [Chthoniobacterales bacterium]
MKLIPLFFCSALLSVVLAGSALGQTADDFALLKKMGEATKDAPTSRLNSTITDRDSGAVLETVTMERVAPDQVHLITTHHGEPATEMISDGKRSLTRKSPNEPWKPLPFNFGQTFHSALNFDQEEIREQHVHLKPLGDDQVDGTAAKIYEMTSDDGTSKIWIAADNSRLLKLEHDYEGTAPIKTPKFDGNLKSLQAQLKAATAQHHLHSLTLYTYDPSIKITMPPQ